MTSTAHVVRGASNVAVVFALAAAAGILLRLDLAGQGGLIEWRAYGGDATGSRYSIADQINRDTIRQLDIAWEWNPAEKALPEFHNALPGNFANTPLMIDNVLYVSTSYNTVAALDAETGREIWRYDPQAYQEIQPQATGWTHRGLTAWWDGPNLRIFLATKHHLVNLDAKTGKPVPSFGEKGSVDLAKNVRWDFNPEHMSNQSAPVVYKDVVIVGWGIGDRLMYRNDPPGVVRAYNARTGRELWNFNIVPAPGEFGTDTWGAQSYRYTGHANVWANMAVDTERGLVYLPTSTPSNDYYGGRRLGANLFAESLVCLDATTGKRKWHFQFVHHGLWDYDLPATPNLVTMTVNGRRIDAVAQVTKTGFTFVFDRVTGKPIWPIEERPVPTDTDVPGERPYATQPFPTKPLPFAGQGVSLDDAFDLTPELKAQAQAQMKNFRLGPLYTPPSMKGTLVRPTGGGGANWGGAAFDPETSVLYVKSSDNVGVLKIEKFDKATSNNPFASWSDADYVSGPSPGASFANGLPISKPPYAHLTAIDLNTGELSWRIPFGKGSDIIRRHPALRGVNVPERLGTPGAPGAIVTKGGLVFIGGGDAALYAFDKSTGAEIWHKDLPRRTGATPMTYQTRSGRQFVVIATGSGTDQSLVAFALGGGGTSRPSTTRAQPAASGPVSGQAAYERACVTCHGREGQGGTAPTLVPLTRSTNEILGVVRNGGAQMMAFSSADVSDTDVEAIVQYLQQLTPRR
jgi:quinoprotein glucose dehydrogenase